MEVNETTKARERERYGVNETEKEGEWERVREKWVWKGRRKEECWKCQREEVEGGEKLLHEQKKIKIKKKTTSQQGASSKNIFMSHPEYEY